MASAHSRRPVSASLGGMLVVSLKNGGELVLETGPDGPGTGVFIYGLPRPSDDASDLKESARKNGTDRRCCPWLLRGRTPTSFKVQTHNVLVAEYQQDPSAIRATVAVPIGNNAVRVEEYTWEVRPDAATEHTAQKFVTDLMTNAYGQATPRKRIKVLINPFGGQGRASTIFSNEIEPILRAANCELDVETTTRRESAIAIAEELDIESFDVVACCSGDGVPHEVFNGFAKRKDAAIALAKVAVVQMPCGSGNAMSVNLFGTASPSEAAVGLVKGIRAPVDLVSVTQGTSRHLSFLSQGIGILAEADLATEHLRWMGASRFTYGVLVRLLRKVKWPAKISLKVALDDKEAIRRYYREHFAKEVDLPALAEANLMHAQTNPSLPPLQYGTVLDPVADEWVHLDASTLGNFYAGNMPYVAADTNFFQAAHLRDGLIDVVTMDSSTPRTESIKAITAVETGTFFEMSAVKYYKVKAYRLTPEQKEGYLSIDGERKPFEAFQVEVHPGLGTVLVGLARLGEEGATLS